MKNAGIALAIVLAILAVVYVGVELLPLDFFFGGILPYIAIAVFIVGFIYRIYKWAQSPVPFRIPTTAGQQNSQGQQNPQKCSHSLPCPLYSLHLFPPTFSLSENVSEP